MCSLVEFSGPFLHKNLPVGLPPLHIVASRVGGMCCQVTGMEAHSPAGGRRRSKLRAFMRGSIPADRRSCPLQKNMYSGELHCRILCQNVLAPNAPPGTPSSATNMKVLKCNLTLLFIEKKHWKQKKHPCRSSYVADLMKTTVNPSAPLGLLIIVIRWCLRVHFIRLKN